jgi:hypothetical protein
VQKKRGPRHGAHARAPSARVHLVFRFGQDQTDDMARSRAAPKSTTKRSYKAVGTLPDGVVILAPKTKPTHFTSRQIRATIQKVLKNRAKNDIDEAAPERPERG